jgi:hypothetical protein
MRMQTAGVKLPCRPRRVPVHRFSMDALRKKTVAAIPRSRVRQVAVANRMDFDGGGLR